VDEDLQRPDLVPVPGLGLTAGSFTGPDGECEFVARMPNGAVRISVDGRPDPPQKFRTDDLPAIAVQVFPSARPRLS
jgi:hypothetical protein